MVATNDPKKTQPAAQAAAKKPADGKPAANDKEKAKPVAQDGKTQDKPAETATRPAKWVAW